MLYHLFVPLSDEIGFLNIFRYLTFRSGGAILTALLICLILGPRMIIWLKSKQGKGQPIREDGPESHLVTKKGTPTMGGLMILLSMFITTLLWADLRNPYIWIILAVTLAFAVIGFFDDYFKVTRQNTKGLRGKYKLIVQFLICFVTAYVINLIAPQNHAGHLALPFFKNILLDLGLFYYVFVGIVIVGASNAANLTDGLDGLATVPIIMVAGCFALISYLTGNAEFAKYLQIHAVPQTGELAVLCAAIIGAGLGFLWFNAPPAKIFMGDTGSLPLGAALGTLSVITKHEIVLAIVGGLFVIEALSVILQVGSYKLRGKRIFKMAPIHHHFEKLGWSETTVVVRFWIVAFVFALLGLATLKIR